MLNRSFKVLTRQLSRKSNCIYIFTILGVLFTLIVLNLSTYKGDNVNWNFIYERTDILTTNLAKSESNFDINGVVSNSVKYPRELNDNSPFKYLPSILNSTESGKDILENWNNPRIVSRTEQCKFLIDAIYHEDENWSNQAGFEKFNSPEDGTRFSSLEAERIRIYNYCFIFGNVNPRDIFKKENEKRNSIDFQNRIYPFLKKPNENEILLPKMFNLSSMKQIELNVPSSTTIEEFNGNFFANWIKMSRGKGIITTFKEHGFAGHFYKLLTILQHLDNKLPIQILVHEDEFDDNFKSILSQMSKQTNQELILVTYTNLLSKKNMDKMNKYINKLLASLFNTFEEYILMDVDVVPFVPMESFFNYKEYKNSGQYIARDRELKTETDANCIDIFKSFEPTKEEVDLIKTSLLTTFTSYDANTPEGTAMDLLSSGMKHVVESGLVVANKVTNYAGMLMTLMMDLNVVLNETYLGDKEFFWFGQLYAGQTFAFEPSTAALIGFPKREYDENDAYLRTSICDTHIGHAHKNKLIWTNSGLDRQKGKGGLFDRDEGNPRMKFNGFLMPERKRGKWRLDWKDYGQMHCGIVVESGAPEAPHGTAVYFDEQEFNRMDKISKLWHDAFF